jgi:hypothetical protein
MMNQQQYELQRIKRFVAACRRHWPGAMIVLRPDTSTDAAPRRSADQTSKTPGLARKGNSHG